MASAGGPATAEPLDPSYEEALEIWRAIGDKREIANALYNHSFIYAVSRDVANADPDGVRARRAGRGTRDSTARSAT